MKHGEKIYVFNEWHSYDDGGMTYHEFDNEVQLKNHLNMLVNKKTHKEALEILEKQIIIVGTKKLPTIKEVISSVKVEL